MNGQTHTETNSSGFKAIAIRLKPGQDLKQQLDEYIKVRHIKAASIVTCVGSLQQAAIRYANQPGTDSLTGKFEIVSLT
ncbi:MAG TPA: PPC domain-containing DNA-binding protein, partial [Segetibacter sp.]